MTGLEDIWDDNNLPPFYGTPKQLMELGEVVGKCIDKCKASGSIREIVLETWITMDFSMRQLLISGFNLTRFYDQEFDTRYLLLPNSFQELIRILKTTRDYCKRHKSKTIPDKTGKVDKIGGFKSSWAFLKFVKEEDPKLFQRINEITDEYRRKMNPELSDIQKVYYIKEPPAENKPFDEFADDWKEVIYSLDDGWFRRIGKLNKARNSATHSYDPVTIAAQLGKTEPNLVDKIRSECFSLLKDLLKVKL